MSRESSWGYRGICPKNAPLNSGVVLFHVDTQVTIGASVGLASSEPDSTVDSLLVAADGEMYVDERRRRRRR